MSKVLIIEDDPSVRDSIKEALEVNDYQMLFASNGLDALETCKDELPDLVISDIMMPYMNGYEVLHAFQSNPKTNSIPFIFLSAKATMSDIRMGMNSGADDYITKPFKVKDLLNAVETRLKKKKKFDDTIKHITQNISLYIPHELRTPLVAIIGYSDLMINDYERINRTELLDMLKGIKVSGKKLYKTIEKFIVYSELSLLGEGAQAYQKSSRCTNVCSITFKQFIADIIKEFEREQDIVIKAAEGTVYVDPDHLRKIIREIVENALKFSEPGSVIEISGNVKDGVYILEITDHGFGFLPQHLMAVSHLNDHDSQGMSESSCKGLGLAIVTKLAEIYNCILKIDSEKDRFTRVSLELPVGYN